jgi:hypothetical protein
LQSQGKVLETVKCPDISEEVHLPARRARLPGTAMMQSADWKDCANRSEDPPDNGNTLISNSTVLDGLHREVGGSIRGDY